MRGKKIILVKTKVDYYDEYDSEIDVETVSYDSIAQLLKENPEFASELTGGPIGIGGAGWKSPEMVAEEEKVAKKLDKAKLLKSFYTFDGSRYLGGARAYDITNIGSSSYQLEQIAKGKFRLLQEVDVKSLLTDTQKKKLKEVKEKLAERAKKKKETAQKKADAKKAKEIEKAKKILEEAGELKK